LNNGKYLFKVKSANRDNIFSEEITELQIVILPPFWKTWWFIFLILILVIVIAYSLLKARERNLRAIDKEKIKVEQLNAIQYKSELEHEQIVNYFTTSLVDKNTVDEVLSVK
jgi:cytochrome c biogenesis protein ResB